MSTNTKDLTEGNVTGKLISFAIPVMLGALFQQFYNIVDTAIVGKTLGVEALAAVGATGSIMFLIIGFCTGMCAGFAIPVAQSFGAKDNKSLRINVVNCLWLGLGLSIVMTILTTLMCSSILRWMSTPENIIDMSYKYLFVIFCGIPATVFYNLFAGIIRALGDSKTPLYMLIMSSLINILLDYTFILVFNMGTAGAGLATIVSQLLAAIICGYLMIKNYPMLRTEKTERKPNNEVILKLLGMGFPMGIQYSITAIGSILLQTSVNNLGSDYVAAMTSGGKINIFAMSPFDSLGTALATFAGQNIGAKKPERVDIGVRNSMIMGTIYTVFVFLTMYFFADKLALIFVDADQTAIIANIRLFMICNTSLFVFLLGVSVFRFAIQGMGFSSLAVVSGFMEMIARGLMGLFVVPRFGFIAACFASPLAWFLACCFLVPAYMAVRKKVRNVFN